MSEEKENPAKKESVAQQETDHVESAETDISNDPGVAEDDISVAEKKAEDSDAEESSEPEEGEPAGLNFGSTCVLLVDDDEDTAKLVMGSIKGFGITNIVRVATAATAYFQLTEDKELFPDFIILELVLPGMTGIQFLAKLRSDPDLRIRNLPVVVLTEVDSASVYQRVTNQNISAYLRKPVAAAALKTAITGALSGKVIEPPLAFGRSWIDEIEDREDSLPDVEEKQSWFRRIFAWFYGGKGRN